MDAFRSRGIRQPPNTPRQTDALTHDERRLLVGFRALSPTEQAAILAILESGRAKKGGSDGRT